MIEIKDLRMKFESFVALDGVSCTIPEGCVFGLCGSNGAGKSTLMRLMCGIYKPSGGSVLVDGESVYERPSAKRRIVFLGDEPYFMPSADLNAMARLYASVYPQFSRERFDDLCSSFGLDKKRSLSHMSKGMRRQAATVLALACRPKYLLLDETFDGLDPIMRDLVKRTVYSDVLENGASVVIASHSLRELEDTCDRIALLHKGGVLLESDLETLSKGVFKVQLAFRDEPTLSNLDAVRESIVSFTRLGAVATLIMRGERETLIARLRELDPLILDVIPMNLEEVFTYEMEARGYAFHEVIKEEKYGN